VLQEVAADGVEQDDAGDFGGTMDEPLRDAVMDFLVRIRKLSQSRPGSIELLGFVPRPRGRAERR